MRKEEVMTYEKTTCTYAIKKTKGIELIVNKNNRYKLEIFPDIWLKSSKPSLWSRIGYFLLLGKFVKILPDIETCNHQFEIVEKLNYLGGDIYRYKVCKVCEYEAKHCQPRHLGL
jgi:hypothetical protein